jgi:hypothetical protein
MKNLSEEIVNKGSVNVHFKTMTKEQKTFVIFLPSIFVMDSDWVSDVDWEAQLENAKVKSQKVVDDFETDISDLLYFNLQGDQTFVSLEFELGFDTLEEAMEIAQFYEFEEIVDLENEEAYDSEGRLIDEHS